MLLQRYFQRLSVSFFHFFESFPPIHFRINSIARSKFCFSLKFFRFNIAEIFFS